MARRNRYGKAWTDEQELKRLTELEILASGRPNPMSSGPRHTAERSIKKTWNIGRTSENDPAKVAFLASLKAKRT